MANPPDERKPIVINLPTLGAGGASGAVTQQWQPPIQRFANWASQGWQNVNNAPRTLWGANAYGVMGNLFSGHTNPNTFPRTTTPTAGAGYTGHINPNTFPRTSPFGFMQNPFNQIAAWQKNVSPFVRQGAGNNGAGSVGMGNGNNGMSADEAKWAGIAGKLGLNWQVVKDVYMNPNRNGTPNVSQAISRAADDKAWGDAAARFGILTGNADRDALIWQEHYNATHNGGRDPMDGHNDAYQAYLNNQAAMEQQANGTPQYPDWYTAP